MSEDAVSGRDDSSAIIIELTDEQQELIRRGSGGALEISHFRLRPEIAMERVIEQQSGEAVVDDLGDVGTSIAPPPRGSYWV